MSLDGAPAAYTWTKEALFDHLVGELMSRLSEGSVPRSVGDQPSRVHANGSGGKRPPGPEAQSLDSAHLEMRQPGAVLASIESDYPSATDGLFAGVASWPSARTFVPGAPLATNWFACQTLIGNLE